jgi:hypothetical protein
VLLQADEALWAGDKTVEGRLKGLITAEVQQIESKGIDPVQLPNYVHLLMTSNADSVVPAGKDERRFAVFDISSSSIGKFGFFAQIDKEMNDGGFEHLLGDLLKFDFSTIDLRRPPQTPALLDQKIEMLDSVDRWWLHCLMRGATLRAGDGWQSVILTTALYDDYAAEAERVGHRWKSDEIAFGRRLAKLMAGSLFKKARATVTVEKKSGHQVKERRKCYFLPALLDARSCFEKVVGQAIDWPEEDDTTNIVGEDDDVV